MNKLVEFTLEDGTPIFVEVDEPIPDSGIQEAARGDKVIQKASESFESAIATLKPASTAVIKRIRNLADPPTEISIEFGLKLSAEAGAYIAAAGKDDIYLCHSQQL